MQTGVTRKFCLLVQEKSWRSESGGNDTHPISYRYVNYTPTLFCTYVKLYIQLF